MAAPNILAATSIYGKSVGSTLTTTDTTDILTLGIDDSLTDLTYKLDEL